MDPRNAIRGALEAFEGIYLEPAIPAKKLANARAACRVPDDEFVIGLIDRTLFGSAKHAVVFGERGFYLCDRWTRSQPVSHAYTELDALGGWSSEARTMVVLVAIRAALERARVARAPSESIHVLPEVVASERRHDEPDVSISPEATALQAAIADAPGDEGPQLVLADLLLAAGDPRGELIVLHNRETTGGLSDPEALERYLELAAEYGFPHAFPEQPTLPFVGSAIGPVRFVLNHLLRDYEIRSSGFTLEVLVGDRVVLARRLRTELPEAWTARETAVILQTISDAIRAGTPLKLLQFPYAGDRLPVYGGGALRCYMLPRDFTGPRGIAENRFGHAARDYQRWMDTWRRLARSLKAAQSA